LLERVEQKIADGVPANELGLSSFFESEQPERFRELAAALMQRVLAERLQKTEQRLADLKQRLPAIRKPAELDPLYAELTTMYEEQTKGLAEAPGVQRVIGALTTWQDYLIASEGDNLREMQEALDTLQQRHADVFPRSMTERLRQKSMNSITGAEKLNLIRSSRS
jgi:hypothetical protein